MEGALALRAALHVVCVHRTDHGDPRPPQAHVDRTSKESLNVPLPKPSTRSRTASANSTSSQPSAAAQQPPSSTGTGIGRLTIGRAPAPAPAAAPAAVPRAAGRSARVPAAAAGVVRALQQPGAVAPAAPKLQQGEWGAPSAAAHLPPTRTDQGFAAPVGLGIAGASVGMMEVDAHGQRQGTKRAHDVEFSDDDEQLDPAVAAAAAFGGAVRHAQHHEDKVRVVEGATHDEDEDEAAAGGEMELDPDDWLLALCDADEQDESERLIEQVKREFKEEIDWWDISMVAEYSDEIFAYMSELEVRFFESASTIPSGGGLTSCYHPYTGGVDAESALHGPPERDRVVRPFCPSSSCNSC